MIKSLTKHRNLLGECPVWSAAEGRLYWLDLLRPALYAWDFASGAVSGWAMPEFLGGLALREAGGLVLGMQSRVAAFNPSSGSLETLFELPEHDEAMRFNDGKADARGRFLVGNMQDPDLAPEGREISDEEKEGQGAIYQLDPDGSWRVCQTGLTIPNGFTWSLDNSLLYLADTHEEAIFVHDYDLETGAFQNRRLFASTRRETGVPDGACLDAEGCLWNARHGGGCIVRYSPAGEVIRKVELPLDLPTSLAFGGPDFATLFVTTASNGLSASELEEQPLAGLLLSLEAGVQGAPVYSYQG